MNCKSYIGLKNLTFAFQPQSALFFDKVTVDFLPQKINFLCGKNGVGKSTLLKILSGHSRSVELLEGLLEIDGNQYDLKKGHEIRQYIGIVSQDVTSMMIDAYSFHENLQCALMQQYPGLQMLPQVQPLPLLLEKYHVNPHIPIRMLSGGQRQILSILMMLQKSPKILLLDEPTAALDEENALLVMNFLQELCVQKNITIIAIVHQLELVYTYAGSTYFELYQESGVRMIRKIQL